MLGWNLDWVTFWMRFLGLSRHRPILRENLQKCHHSHLSVYFWLPCLIQCYIIPAVETALWRNIQISHLANIFMCFWEHLCLYVHILPYLFIADSSVGNLKAHIVHMLFIKYVMILAFSLNRLLLCSVVAYISEWHSLLIWKFTVQLLSGWKWFKTEWELLLLNIGKCFCDRFTCEFKRKPSLCSANTTPDCYFHFDY